MKTYTEEFKKTNEELDKKIKEEYEKSKKRYSSPKITKILNQQGIKVSQKRVARRMKVLVLKSIIIKKYNHNGKYQLLKRSLKKIYKFSFILYFHYQIFYKNHLKNLKIHSIINR